MILEKPMKAATTLKIKLERSAQVRMPNPGRRYPGAHIQKRDPTGTGGKMVTQMWCKSHQPLGIRRKLSAAEYFQAEFKIASIPMAFCQNVIQHAPIGKANQRQIMRFDAAECLQSIRSPGAETE